MEKINTRRVGVVVGILLLIAFVCNFIVDGWYWGPLDFVVLGILLFVTGLSLEYVIATIKQPLPRILACSAIVFILIAIWTELAVDAVSQLLAWFYRVVL